MCRLRRSNTSDLRHLRSNRRLQGLQQHTTVISCAPSIYKVSSIYRKSKGGFRISSEGSEGSNSKFSKRKNAFLYGVNSTVKYVAKERKEFFNRISPVTKSSKLKNWQLKFVLAWCQQELRKRLDICMNGLHKLRLTIFTSTRTYLNSIGVRVLAFTCIVFLSYAWPFSRVQIQGDTCERVLDWQSSPTSYKQA